MDNSKIIISGLLSFTITVFLLLVAAFKPMRTYPPFLENPYQSENRVTGKLLSDNEKTLIVKELLLPISIELHTHINPHEDKVCMNGLNYRLKSKQINTTGYLNGIVENYEKCESKEICLFRLKVSEKRIEVFDKINKRFIPSEVWLQDFSSNQ